MSLPPAVADYVAGHHVMTLATQGAGGPWAAAVFYATDGDSLIFLSSPSSRHCRDLAQDPRCAATIQEDYGEWPQIKGIQVEGWARQLSGEEAVRAQRLYGAKFPLADRMTQAPPAIAAAMAEASWFRLEAERMYFIDNSQGFGHREEFELKG